jgi:hypothetical protein
LAEGAAGNRGLSGPAERIACQTRRSKSMKQ